MQNTITNSSGKTMWLVTFNGVTYGYMTAKAQREFYARQALKASK